MALRGFRRLPENLLEWGRWFREQDFVTGDDVDARIAAALNTSTVVTANGTTIITNTIASTWEFVDITASYTVRQDDIGKIIRSNTGSAHNVTIPAAILEEGEQIVFYQKGAGTMTLVAGSGFTINTPTTLVMNEQYGTITLIAESGTAAFIAGRMSST